MSSQPLALRSTPLTEPARYAFDSDQLALIKRTVARGADDNSLLLFLELVSRYKLDPFIGQAYLVQMPGRDGAAGQHVTIVSRDGLLSIANRNEGFLGMEGDIVRKGDLLARDEDGFAHLYEPTDAAERIAQPIVGAWNKVYRDRRRPTFFFAPFAQYKRNNKVWTQYPDAMILKVAESMSLRKAFSITGLIPEDEVGATYAPEVGATIVEGSADVIVQEPDWGEDEELALRLRLLFEEANRVRPGSFREQKVRLQLAGADRERRLRIAQDVENFVLKNGGAAPVVGDPPNDEPPEPEPERGIEG